eukprot:1425122-Amphidinium_carterae.1
MVAFFAFCVAVAQLKTSLHTAGSQPFFALGLGPLLRWAGLTANSITERSEPHKSNSPRCVRLINSGEKCHPQAGQPTKASRNEQ